jgi:hypothetical protein
MARKKLNRLEPLRAGQIWEVEDTNLQIGLVGKTLIHYKRYKGKTRGVPSSIASRTDLERFLKAHKAVLVQE